MDSSDFPAAFVTLVDPVIFACLLRQSGAAAVA